MRYTAGLARGLRDAGCEPALLTRTHDMEFGSIPGAMRDYVGRSAPGIRHEMLPGRVRDLWAVGATLRAWRRLREFGADVIHLQDAVLNDPRLLFAARARPGRYALTVHDLEAHPGDAAQSRRQLAAFGALIRAAGLIFVHAESLRERLIELRRPRAPVVALPHGVDPPTPAAMPAQPSLLLFGRMSYYKGLGTLLDALPAVWERVPQLRLTVAGNGEIEDHPRLADSRVELLNRFIPDGEVAGIFEAATCVVLPYREASMSGVAVLAKRHGRPVIASAVGGLRDLAGDGATLLVPPEDPQRLAEAIVDVIASPGAAERMGRRGAESIREQFGWDRVAEVTVEAYRRHLLAPSE